MDTTLIAWDPDPRALAADPAATIARDRAGWEARGARFSEYEDEIGGITAIATAAVQVMDATVELGVLDQGEPTTYLLVSGGFRDHADIARAVIDALRASGVISRAEILELVPANDPRAPSDHERPSPAGQLESGGGSGDGPAGGPFPEIGTLEFRHQAPGPRSWVIGAAPQTPPFRKLYLDDEPVARLVLLFENDAEAIGELSAWLAGTSRAADADLITSYLQRELFDLTIRSDVVVTEVARTPELLAWLNAVVGADIHEVPEALVSGDWDVLVFPHHGGSGTPALLRETSLAGGISYEHPRLITVGAP